MSYLLAVLVPIVFMLILHYATELDMEKKLVSVAVIFTVVMGAIYYNSTQNRLRETIIKNELVYEQNRTLKCFSYDLGKVVEVNQSNFSYSSGTQTFIGKEKTPFYNLMINIEKCN